MGFTALNICVAVLSLAYAPALYYLRGFHTYQNYDEDADVGGGGTKPRQLSVRVFTVCTYFGNVPLSMLCVSTV